MNYTLLFIPFISAFIGWFANSVIIKMLFRPTNSTKILGITFQGIFPKRKKEFAEQIGKLVSNELLSFQDIEERITNPKSVEKLMPLVEEHIDNFLRHKLKEKMPIISMFIGDKTINELKGVFTDELKEIFPQIMVGYIANLKSDLDLEKTIVEKISTFSTIKLEENMNNVLRKEFRLVKIIGAVLGFTIGLLQILITFISK